MLQRIDHVNLVVEDLAGMESFYRDALGMRVTRRTAITGDWIASLTGFGQVDADVVYLEARSGAGLELIRYRKPQGSRPPALGQPNTSGIRHVAFRVEALDGMVARMRQAGVEFLSDVQEVPPIQVDFQGQQKRIVYCRDPEGNLLELCAFQDV